MDDGELEQLFTLPPDRFVEARNELAKRLRAEGRRDEADEVKTLPRPPVSAWALNDLTRSEPALIEGFLAAAAALRQAQEEGGDIRAATGPERDAEARLLAAAEQRIRELGRPVTSSTLDRLRQSLRASAADPAAAAELARGRLTADLEPPSTEDLLARMKPRPHMSRAKVDRAAARRELADARARAAELRREAEEAAAEARRLRTGWERAKKRADAAAAALEEATAALEGLTRRSREPP